MSRPIIVASRYAIPSLDQMDEVFGTHTGVLLIFRDDPFNTTHRHSRGRPGRVVMMGYCNEACRPLLQQQDVFTFVREPLSRALPSSCGFAALHNVTSGMLSKPRGIEFLKEYQMKKLLVAAVATLVAVSVAGCAAVGKGKGKAPPPIVTKG